MLLLLSLQSPSRACVSRVHGADINGSLVACRHHLFAVCADLAWRMQNRDPPLSETLPVIHHRHTVLCFRLTPLASGCVAAEGLSHHGRMECDYFWRRAVHASGSTAAPAPTTALPPHAVVGASGSGNAVSRFLAVLSPAPAPNNSPTTISNRI